MNIFEAVNTIRNMTDSQLIPRTLCSSNTLKEPLSVRKTKKQKKTSQKTVRKHKRTQKKKKTMKVVFLGTNAGLARDTRACQCYGLIFDEDEGAPVVIIDCGTGSFRQVVDKRCPFQPSQIKAIFITHIHGDHAAGLLELLSEELFASRQEPLHVYGPTGLKRFIDLTFSYMQVTLSFAVEIHEVELPLPQGAEERQTEESQKPSDSTSQQQDTAKEIPVEKHVQHVTTLTFSKSSVTVHTFPLFHSVTSHGYFVVREEAETGRKQSAVLLGDTANSDSLLLADFPLPDSIDVLVHEATFHHDMIDRIPAIKHSTNIMAVDYAKRIRAKVLILFHFSNRYPDRDVQSKPGSKRSISVREIVEHANSADESISVIGAHDFFEYTVQ